MVKCCLLPSHIFLTNFFAGWDGFKITWVETKFDLFTLFTFFFQFSYFVNLVFLFCFTLINYRLCGTVYLLISCIASSLIWWRIDQFVPSIHHRYGTYLTSIRAIWLIAEWTRCCCRGPSPCSMCPHWCASSFSTSSLSQRTASSSALRSTQTSKNLRWATFHIFTNEIVKISLSNLIIKLPPLYLIVFGCGALRITWSPPSLDSCPLTP